VEHTLYKMRQLLNEGEYGIEYALEKEIQRGLYGDSKLGNVHGIKDIEVVSYTGGVRIVIIGVADFRAIKKFLEDKFKLKPLDVKKGIFREKVKGQPVSHLYFAYKKT